MTDTKSKPLSLYDIAYQNPPPMSGGFSHRKTAADVEAQRIAEDGEQGFGGDAVDAFQMGAGQSAAGMAETVYQITGSETAGKLRDATQNWAKGQMDQMSDSGREAMGKQFFSEDENGDVQFGEAWSDPESIGLQFSNMAGQLAGQVVTGFGFTGPVAKVGAKVVTKNLIKRGLAKGMTKEAAQEYAKSMIRSGAGVTGQALAGAGITGGQMGIQVRDEIMNLADSDLDESNEFRKLYYQLHQQNPNATVSELRKTATKTLAERVATSVQADPLTITANLTLDAIGGRYIDNLIRGVGTGKRLTNAGMQAIGQGIPEAAQGGMEQFNINRAMVNEGVDTDRDLMEGVATNALNEGVLGAGMGGAMGALTKGTPREKPSIQEQAGELTEGEQAQENNTQESHAQVQAMPLLPASVDAPYYMGTTEEAKAARQQTERAMTEQQGQDPGNAPARMRPEDIEEIPVDEITIDQEPVPPVVDVEELPGPDAPIDFERQERDQSGLAIQDYEPERGIDFNSADRTDDLADRVKDQIRKHKLPKGLDDGRLMRSHFRSRLENMANELIPGGGVMSIPRDPMARDNPDKRYFDWIPSQNPMWFQDAPDEVKRLGVKGFKKTVAQALAGRKLGKGQARAVRYMLDHITSERNEYARDYARPEREDFVKFRKVMRGEMTPQEAGFADSDPVPQRYSDAIKRIASSGDQRFTDTDYEAVPGGNGVGHALADDIREALDSGLPENVVTEVAKQFGDDPVEFSLRLFVATEAHKNGQEITPASIVRAANQRALEKESADRGEEPEWVKGESEPEAEEELLTSYTEEDLRQKEADRQQAEKVSSETELKAQQKAKADAEVDSFALAGSNAETDQAAAAGQGNLLDTETQEKDTSGDNEYTNGKGVDFDDPELQKIIDHRVDVAQKEILEDIDNGTIDPAKVSGWEDLDDFSDANMYINDADRGEDRMVGPYGKRHGWRYNEFVDFTSHLIEKVDDWIKSGGLNQNEDKTPAPAGVSRSGDAKKAGEPKSKPAPKPTSDLPEILTATRKAYLKKMARAEGLKPSSPGYESAMQRIEDQYETDVDRAQSALSFEQFNELNSDSPEGLNRQAWTSLREEYGEPEQTEQAAPEDDDKPIIRNSAGNPYKNKGAARKALKKHPGYELVEVEGGFELHPVPEGAAEAGNSDIADAPRASATEVNDDFGPDAESGMAPEDDNVTITASESSGSGGQTDGALIALSSGRDVGRLDYTVFDGVPSVMMIEVKPEYRRRGIATSLMLDLQSKYPNQTIETGYLSEDGAKWYQALPKTNKKNDAYQEKVGELEKIEAKLKRYDGLASEFRSKERTEDEISSFNQKTSDWNDLHDRADDIRSELSEMDEFSVLLDDSKQTTAVDTTPDLPAHEVIEESQKKPKAEKPARPKVENKILTEDVAERPVADTPEVAEIKKEIKQLQDKRSKMRERHMERYRNGSATRARTTTHNAEVSRLNERLDSLRASLKELTEKPRSKPRSELKKPESDKQASSAYQGINNVMKRLSGGEAVTKAELSRTFEALVADPDASKAELRKLKKADLEPMINSHIFSDTKKEDMVRMAYQGLVQKYRFIGSSDGFITWSHGSDVVQTTRDHIESLTDATIAEYAKQRKADIDAAIAERKKRIDGLKDPKTLDEFRDAIKVLGFESLSLEQRTLYDRLIAEKAMRDTPIEDVRKGFQSDEAVAMGEPEEGTHGKTGETIFNVKVIDRLGKDKFKEAAAMARSMSGGYWRGNFYFPTLEQANQFKSWMQGEDADLSERAEERRQQKLERASDRMRDIAERLETDADESLNADRKTNTLRRADMAAGARARAETQKTLAKVMAEIADGDYPLLKNANQKVQVELLNGLANRLIYDADPELFQHDRMSRRSWNDGVTPEQKVQFAKMPLQTYYPDSAKDLAGKMEVVKGFKQAANALRAQARSSKDGKPVVIPTRVREKILEFTTAHGDKYTTHYDVAMSRKRLERMGIENLPTLRAVLAEFIKLKAKVEGPKRKTKLADLEDALQRTVLGNRKAFNDFFPTPESTANEIASLANIEEGMAVLEPSAGNGLLADEAKASGAEVDTVELAGQLREILKEKGHNIIGDDFLELAPEQKYDRVLMNPPFSKDQDIDHVVHAYQFLKPGGRLVAIVSGMTGDRSNKKNKEFRALLDEVGAEEQALPEGAFKSSLNPTGVNTKVIVMDKPEKPLASLSDDVDEHIRSLASQFSGKSRVQTRSTAKQVRGWLEDMAEGMDSVEVVETSLDLPGRVKIDLGAYFDSADGAYDIKTGKTYIVAGNIRDQYHAKRVFLHEVVGHGGVINYLKQNEKLGGKAYLEMLDDIYYRAGHSVINKDIDRYAFDYDNPDERRIAVLEYIAHLAEKGKKMGLVQRVIAALRDLIRKFNPDIDWTDTDTLALIEKGRRHLQTHGNNGKGGSGALPMVAYHGTPHIFDRFSLDAVGTGEGAQAYGWGLYFAGKKEIAEWYQKELSARRVRTKNGEFNVAEIMRSLYETERMALALVTSFGGDFTKARSEAIKRGEDREYLDTLDYLEREVEFLNLDGNLYRADIPEDSELVDFDLPLSQQSDEIKDRLLSLEDPFITEAINTEPVSMDDGEYWSYLGNTYDSEKEALGDSTIAEVVTGRRGGIGKTPRDVSLALNSVGIPGLMYLNGDSRGGKGEDRNYVIWDESRITIEAVNGQLWQAEVMSQPGGGTVLARLSDDLAEDSSLSDAEKSALSKIGPKGPVETAAEKVRGVMDGWRLKVRQGLVDRYAGLMELDKQLLDGNITSEENITRSAWARAKMSNAASGAVSAMMNAGRIFMNKDGIVDVKKDTNGLIYTLNKLGSSAEIERFMGWIAGNRGEKLMAEGRENLFTPEDIQALKGLNRGELKNGGNRNALYEKVFKEFQQYRDDVLAIAEESGIITSENREMWANEFYVPFYRLDEDNDDTTGPRVMGGLSRQQAYKKLKGGTQNLNDLLQNTLMNFHHLVDASLKNMAAKQGIDNAVELGAAEKTVEAARDKKQSTFILRNGEKEWYDISDPMVYSSLTSLNHTGMNGYAMSAMRWFKRTFTNLTTSTPQFVVANLLRDSMSAVAVTDMKKNAAGNIAQGLKSFGLLDRNGYERARLMASGGAFSFGHVYGEDADSIRYQIDGQMRRANIVKNPRQILRLIGWDRWMDVNNSLENVNRAAAFKQAEDAGKGTMYAAFQARDLMDFSAHGAWPAVRFLIDVVPFLNARLQGLDKLYRSGVKPSTKVVLQMLGVGSIETSIEEKKAAARFSAVVGALSVATMTLFAHNQDDEEYRKAPDWLKDSYWWFRIPGMDHVITIPKPFEVGAIATVTERLLEQGMDDEATGKLFRERIWHMLTSTFSFSPVPQAFQPVLDVYANKDSFTERQIETMGQSRLSKSNRVNEGTTGAAKMLSKVTTGVFGEDSNYALSPVQMDFLIGGYLGQIGAWVSAIPDVVVRQFSDTEKPSVFLTEYQPIKRFYRDASRPSYTKDAELFYDSLRKADRLYADMRKYREEGDMEEYADTLRENRDLLGMRKLMNQVNRRLQEIRNRIKAIEKNGSLSAEEKRRQIDLLKLRRNHLIERVSPKLKAIDA